MLVLLGKAPTPELAAKLTARQILPMLKGYRNKDAKAAQIQQILRGEHLGQPPVVTRAYAASVRSSVAVLVVIGEEITHLETEVKAHFGQHPDAEIILSQPGLGPILGARVLAEFGDAPGRYRSSKDRKNYAGTSPITRQSGKVRIVAARYIHNDRLVDAHQWTGLLRDSARPRSPRLLRPAPRPPYQAQRRSAPGRQPARRCPPRLPQRPNPIRPKHSMGPSTHHRCLTIKRPGMS